MKKKISIAVLALFVGFMSLNIGCGKVVKDTIPDVGDLPDVSNFSLDYASVFTEGVGSLISIASSSLDDGDYTVYFDLSGANIMSDVNAILSMAGGKGTFKTPSLSQAGDMTIMIKSIANSEGKKSTLTTNNVKNFTDSNGLMTWTYKGTSYTVKHVIASMLGDNLSIVGRGWTAPGLQHILYFDAYPSAPSVCNFSKASLPTHGGAQVSTDLQIARYGTITVTNSTPLLTGTFSYTNPDSTKVTLGTFSCKAP